MLHNITIKQKLIVAFILTGLIPLVVVALYSTSEAKKHLREEAFAKLEAIKEIKKKQITTFFKERAGDVEIMAKNPYVIQAMIQLQEVYDREKSHNGVFKGEGNERFQAPEGYKIVHNQYFSYFKSFMSIYGYYDVFLMHADDGDTCFTVTKEADFGIKASNFNSSLKDVWEIASHQRKTAISDTKPYAPSNHIPAQFVATPIEKDGKVIGVLAFQISTDAVNGMMQERSGMGRSGETYLVGGDKRMRSDSFVDKTGAHSLKESFKGTVEKNGVDTVASREALAGKTGKQVIKDYNNNNVLSAYSPLKIGDFTWALISEIDEAEVDQPVRAIEHAILIMAGVILGFLLLISFGFATSLNRGIKRVVDQFKQLTGAVVEGKLDTRGDPESVLIDFKGILIEVNRLIDAFVGPINVTAEYVERITQGDIPPKITDEYYGDFNEIKNNLNGCIDVMNQLIQESESLVDRVQIGQLETKASSEAFVGSWKTLINSINVMVETFVSHLDAIPAPVMLVDREFNIQFMNHFGARVGNSSRKQLINSKCYHHFKTSHCNTDQCGVSRAMRDSRGVAGEANAQPGSTHMEISYNAAPVKNLNGEIVGGVKVMTDQTEQKQAAKIARKVDQYQGREVEKLAELLKKMSRGDLTGIYEIEQGDRDTEEVYHNFKMIEKHLNDTLRAINEILGQINIASNQVNNGAGQVSDASQSLSQGATEQASSLEEISSSMQEIGSQTQQNAENALKANELSGEAKVAASKGNQQMSELMNAVGEIAESSKDISKIIKVIDEIAFQTNLLALNAAVEAARAGQHGKGFAVVAEEVRNLAARSAKAAKETAELIEEAIKKSERGADLATTTAGILSEIDQSANKVSDIVEEISRASGEQALGISQINSSLNQVEQVTQQNTANAEESAAAAEELSGQARTLKENLGRFKIKGQKELQQSYLTSGEEQYAQLNQGGELVRPDEVIQLSDNHFGKY